VYTISGVPRSAVRYDFRVSGTIFGTDDPPPVVTDEPEDPPPVVIEDPEDPPPVEIEDPVVPSPIEYSLSDIKHLKERQLIYGQGTDGSAKFIIFKSVNDVEEFIALVKAQLGSKWNTYSAAISVSAALREYGDEFFSSSNLVMVMKPESSGGNRIEVE